MIENVLSGITGVPSSTHPNDGSTDYGLNHSSYTQYGISQATDNNIENAWGWITNNSDNADSGQNAIFTLNSTYTIKDIASIVYYSDQANTAAGVSVQLLDNNDIILYTYEIPNTISGMEVPTGYNSIVERFDGPAINNVYESSFTDEISSDNRLANKIIVLDKAVKN